MKLITPIVYHRMVRKLKTSDGNFTSLVLS
jgi:hypothetical protein